MARRVDLNAVRAEIEDAVESVCMGAHPHQLEGSAKLAIATILHRHGLGHSRVQVRRSGLELLVDVQFPPSIPEILQIRVRAGGL